MNAQLEEAYVAGVMSKLAEYGLEGLEKDAQFWAGLGNSMNTGNPISRQLHGLKGMFTGMNAGGLGGVQSGRTAAMNRYDNISKARGELGAAQLDQFKGTMSNMGAPIDNATNYVGGYFGGGLQAATDARNEGINQAKIVSDTHQSAVDAARGRLNAAQGVGVTPPAATTPQAPSQTPLAPPPTNKDWPRARPANWLYNRRDPYHV